MDTISNQESLERLSNLLACCKWPAHCLLLLFTITMCGYYFCVLIIFLLIICFWLLLCFVSLGYWFYLAPYYVFCLYFLLDVVFVV